MLYESSGEAPFFSWRSDNKLEPKEMLSFECRKDIHLSGVSYNGKERRIYNGWIWEWKDTSGEKNSKLTHLAYLAAHARHTF